MGSVCAGVRAGNSKGGQKSFLLHLVSDTLFTELLLYAKSWAGYADLGLNPSSPQGLGFPGGFCLDSSAKTKGTDLAEQRSFPTITTCKCPIQALNLESIFSAPSVPPRLLEELCSALEAEICIFHPLLCW